ncbi:MAG: hypothetical protein ABI461_18250, partial [Polyangiaceae bacterium]
DRSLPNVFGSSIPSAGAPSVATLSVSLPDAAPARHIRLELDFRVDSLGDISAGQDEDLFSLTLSNGSSASTEYAAHFHADQLVVSVGSPPLILGFSAPPKPGVWTHAVFDTQLDANFFSATIGVTTQTNMLVDTARANTRPKVSVGLLTSGSSTGTSISYDNVILVADNVDAD